MKIKASKKLIGSLFALVVAVSLAATTTYAWFTMNAVVDVGSFDLKVQSATPGLYVSTARNGTYTTSLDLSKYIGEAKKEYAAPAADAAKKAILDAEAVKVGGAGKVWSTWVETLTFTGEGYDAAAAGSDVTGGPFTSPALYETAVLSKAKYNASIYEFSMTDITWNSADKKMEKEGTTPTVDQHATLNTLTTAKSGGTDPFAYSLKDGYLTFKLYFRGDAKYDVYLNSTSTLVPKSTTAPNATPSYTWTDFSAQADILDMYGAYAHAAGANGKVAAGINGKIETRAAYAARVKFDIKNETTEEITGGTPAAAVYGTAATTIWEPNSEMGFSNDRVDVKHRNLAQDVKSILFGTDGTTTPVNVGNIWTLDSTFQDYIPQIKDFSTSGAKDLHKEFSPLVTLAANNKGAFYSEMTITIWLEGWDEDCLNSILQDDFTTKLEFIAEFANP